MIRRFFTRILMVILIVLCGYNIWQVQELRQEVARLQQQSADRSAGAISVTGQSWLDQANLHADRARAAMGKGNFPAAQRELSDSIAAVRQAAARPERQTQQTLTQMRLKLAALRNQADDLFHRMHPGATHAP